MIPQPSVLDACCGSRMMWFDKSDQRALFVDKRRETITDPTGRSIVIDPDHLADFTALPFAAECFDLVVFDPPHTFCEPRSVMAKKYGRLLPGWREEIAAGIKECFRVDARATAFWPEVRSCNPLGRLAETTG